MLLKKLYKEKIGQFLINPTKPQAMKKLSSRTLREIRSENNIKTFIVFKNEI